MRVLIRPPEQKKGWRHRVKVPLVSPEYKAQQEVKGARYKARRVRELLLEMLYYLSPGISAAVWEEKGI
jgi:hypothetical protein